MELRHLRYFVAVADEHTFVRGAERLRVAQPALSRQIKDLEKELALPLFDRGPRAAALTPGGESCLATARAILRACEESVSAARLSHHGMSGRCIMGCGTGMMWTTYVTQILAMLRSEFPAIDVQVVEITHRRQWDAIRDCTIDIGLGGPVPTSYVDLASETLAHTSFAHVMVAATHPLANRTRITLEELRDIPLIRLEDSIWEEDVGRMRAEFTRRGFAPVEERLQVSPEGIAAQVMAGLGWTLYPRSFPDLPGGVVIPLEDFEMPSRSVRIWRRADERPVIQTVLDVTRRFLDPAPNATPSDGNGLHEGALSLRLELRHLRYFKAVVEQGSVGRAAEALDLTQPALSRQMRDLEDIVGVPLLARDPRGVKPTPSGETFHHHAEEVLGLVDQMQAAATRGRRAMQRECIVASVPTPVVQQLLATTVRALAEAKRDVTVHIVDIPTPQQANALRSAEVDIAVGHAIPAIQAGDASLVRQRLFDDEYNMAIVHQSHPLATRRAVDLRELADTPFLFIPRSFNPPLYDYVMACFAALDFRPRIDEEYEGLKTLWAMTTAGIGWCIGMQSQLQQPPVDTVVIPIRDLRIPWGVDLLFRADENRESVLAVRDAMRGVTERSGSSAYAIPPFPERSMR